MEHEVLHVKRARLLPKNEVREMVMYSVSDGEKYYTSEDTEDKEEQRPPSRRSSISQPRSPDFPASSSEDEDENGRKWNSFAVHSTDKRWYVLGIIT